METFYAQITGKLLGNAVLKRKHDGMVHFSFRNMPIDFEWMKYCYDKLKQNIPIAKPVLNRNTFLVNSTGTSYIIEELYSVWYENESKILPLNFLESHLTEETLAWWYQDAGHLKKKANGTLEKIILSTEQWTDEERALLQYILNLKFGLLFAIDGQNRLILYDQLQINYFLTLVEPWLHPSMIRKMKTVSILKPIAKRTTITLPSSIKLSKPTQQINEAIENLSSDFNSEQIKKWNYQRLEINETQSYQIKLNENNRDKLAKFRAKSGLTLNEIVQEAFLQAEKSERLILNDFETLTTTQQAVMLGSILADGSLRKQQTNIHSTSYYENSCEEQRSYRQWKVNKLKHYLYFPGPSPVIVTRKSAVWMDLEKIFYTSERIKRIPLHFLKDVTDPHFLMTLYLDDGSLMISHRINHRNQKIYILPHIALYLQNFHKEELSLFTTWLNSTFNLQLKLAGRPDGHGFYIRTTSVRATFDFLKVFEKIALSYPKGSHKTNWHYRWFLEKTKWQKKYPTYEVLLSSRERMRPYSEEEIETLIKMKKENYTDQQIANQLERTYWSVVYKLRELRKSQQMH